MNPDVNLGDTTQRHTLVLLDYSKLIGNAIDIQGKELTFLLHGSEVESVFPLSDIRYLGIYLGGKEERKNRFTSEGPPFSDFTYLRSALPMEGKGRLRVINVVYSIAEFNLNKNIQLGVGLLTPFGPLLTQRFRFSVGKYLHLGLSHQFSAILIDPFSGVFLTGDARAIATYGTPERFLNFGIGKAYSTQDNDPMVNTISVAGGAKLGRGWHVYGELGLYDGSFDDTIIPTFSASKSEGRHRWRFGILTIVVPDVTVIPLPFVGYDYHW